MNAIIRKIVLIKTMKEMLENETFSAPTSLVSIIKNKKSRR